MATDRDPRPPALGPRGEGWVILQGVLLVAVVLAGTLGDPWPTHLRLGLRIAAILPAVAGSVLMAGGIRRLGEALTPYPRPVANASLREDGVYGIVRHPIYGGVLLLAVAWSLWTSPLALLTAACLAALFEGKRRREETWLAETYPAYRSYRERVPRRFIPFVW